MPQGFDAAKVTLDILTLLQFPLDLAGPFREPLAPRALCSIWPSARLCCCAARARRPGFPQMGPECRPLTRTSVSSPRPLFPRDGVPTRGTNQDEQYTVADLRQITEMFTEGPGFGCERKRRAQM